jgi:hypothetical protein
VKADNPEKKKGLSEENSGEYAKEIRRAEFTRGMNRRNIHARSVFE